MKRREFIRNSSLLSAISLLPMDRLYAAEKKIRVAAIGINGMGWSDLEALLKVPNVDCVALCDVDARVLSKRKAELSAKGIQVKTYENYKELLQDKSIDAVIIGTPDHWHALQMIDACKAGKAVYIEKPLGNSMEECDRMVAVAQQQQAIVQVGQWQRSQQHFRDAIAFVHSGKLGKIRLVKAWAYQGWMKSIPVKADEPVPAGVNYDLWLGPATKRPFNANRFHFEFRWFWDYAGGLMTDWGVHMLDYALHGMQVSDPKSIMAAGGKFAYPTDAAETPDTLTTVFEFDDFNIQWEHANGIDLGPYSKDHGVAFIGNFGTLIVNRGGWEVIPEKDRMEAVAFKPSVDNGLEKHMENFVTAIRSKDRSLLNCPVESGAHIAKLCQMGNIAYKTGKKIFWDKQSASFDTAEANKLRQANYQNGYKLTS